MADTDYHFTAEDAEGFDGESAGSEALPPPPNSSLAMVFSFVGGILLIFLLVPRVRKLFGGNKKKSRDYLRLTKNTPPDPLAGEPADSEKVVVNVGADEDGEEFRLNQIQVNAIIAQGRSFPLPLTRAHSMYDEYKRSLVEKYGDQSNVIASADDNEKKRLGAALMRRCLATTDYVIKSQQDQQSVQMIVASGWMDKSFAEEWGAAAMVVNGEMNAIKLEAEWMKPGMGQQIFQQAMQVRQHALRSLAEQRKEAFKQRLSKEQREEFERKEMEAKQRAMEQQREMMLRRTNANKKAEKVIQDWEEERKQKAEAKKKAGAAAGTQLGGTVESSSGSEYESTDDDEDEE